MAKDGINRMSWPLNRDRPRPPQEADSEEYRPRGGFYVSPGEYVISLILDSDTSRQKIMLLGDTRFESAQSEILEKEKIINQYYNQVERATRLTDDIRIIEKRVDIIANLLDHNQIPKEDTLHANLDSVRHLITTIKESALGATDIQGIYRDPATLTSLIGRLGYTIDHPLAAVTENEKISLNQLISSIDRLESECLKMKKQITQYLAPAQKLRLLDFWD